MKKVTAIFDIGKTNKKFFLFDSNYKEVYREYCQFDEIEDEEGFPAENLVALQTWLKKTLDQVISSNAYDIRAINFSTYGASFVYLDENKNILTPLYNYLKPLPQNISDQFYAKFGDAAAIATDTASPKSGMLNSGMQLYWLKQTKPEIFAKIKHALHFPQFISHLFSGVPISEYTSIGCHTALWDYQKKEYHHWTIHEGITEKFPKIVSSKTYFKIPYKDIKIKVGVGIHDSSSALIPYLRSEKKTFVLISTGTWSISLNPFYKDSLTKHDIENDCLNYLTVSGKAVRATRLFVGKTYDSYVKTLCEYFDKPSNYHKSIAYDVAIHTALKTKSQPFQFLQVPKKSPEQIHLKKLSIFDSFEEAFHQLMIALTTSQIHTTKLAIGKSKIKKIYIDGGFADNEIFIQLLAQYFKEYKVCTTQSPLGSALGAAMVISKKKLPKRFLKEEYKMRKLNPFTTTKITEHEPTKQSK